MSSKRTKKIVYTMKHERTALCPHCNYDVTAELENKVKAGTHTHGAVQFCPNCGKPTPWRIWWEMIFDGFSVITNEPKEDKVAALPEFEIGNLGI